MEDQLKHLQKIAAELLASKRRGASQEDIQTVYMRGLLRVTQLKGSIRQLTEETEQVKFQSLPC
jgi:hypothetical protein